FFFQAEDGIRDFHVTGVQTCALPLWARASDQAIRWVPRPEPRSSRCTRTASTWARLAAPRDSPGTKVSWRVPTTRAPRTATARRSEERRVGREWGQGWEAGA